MSSGERGCLAALLIVVSLITLLGAGCGLLVGVGSHGSASAGYVCCVIGFTLTILLWVGVTRVLKPRKQNTSQEVK
jgi:hypothetical protein